jgi:hypothetical protein
MLTLYEDNLTVKRLDNTVKKLGIEENASMLAMFRTNYQGRNDFVKEAGFIFKKNTKSLMKR